MNEDLKKLGEMQHETLRELAKEKPELFTQISSIEDNEHLGEFGIFIPEKDELPLGCIKFSPQEFIVEEIPKDGAPVSVSPANENIPRGDGPTMFATLVKCGMSTFDAAIHIAQSLGVPVEKVKYAGIKDKDALTAQRISFPAADTIPSSPYFFLKDLEKSKGSLQKGDLAGNRFDILVRTDRELGEEGQAAFSQKIEAIKRDGFYNFFYKQRFDAPRFINFIVAREIIKGDYESAVRIFLTRESENELPCIGLLRRQIAALMPDWAEVAKICDALPIIFLRERKIVSWLAGHPGDYLGALMAVRDQVEMWMWGLSSLLFNEKLSGFTRRGKNPPSHLPLVFSPNKEDVLAYADLLKPLDIFPLSTAHIRPFGIYLSRRMIETKKRVNISKVEFMPQGIHISFTLGPGEYATTFLSHIANLVVGAPPSWIPKTEKGIALSPEHGPSVEYFSPVIRSKHERDFLEKDTQA